MLTKAGNNTCNMAERIVGNTSCNKMVYDDSICNIGRREQVLD